MPLTPEPARPRLIQLPRSSSRLERGYAHLKLLTAVLPRPYAAGFEGRVCAPGALVDAADLAEHAVVLECAGHVPNAPETRGRPRPLLWILWRYDRRRAEWCEIARAHSLSWDWAAVLRGPAIDALHPRPVLYDVIERSHALTGEIVDVIDGKLVAEKVPVKANVLCGVYDRVAGRIADL